MKLKLLCVVLIAVMSLPLVSVADSATQKLNARSVRTAALSRLPLSFEPTTTPDRYVARAGGYVLSVTAHEAMVSLAPSSDPLRVRFSGASSAARIEPLEKSSAVTNYYIGRDRRDWRLGIANFTKLRSRNVYPGIDVIYYGDQRRLEFDFVVTPGADTRVIALTFAGMQKLYAAADGDLVADADGHQLRLAKPFAYQVVGGQKKPVNVTYELLGAGMARLQVGQYDRARELVIDPVVSYATYLGGTQADVANAVAVDTAGSAYLTGQACGNDFPHTGTANVAGCDAYVTKLSPDGSAVVYTTFIGGSAGEKGTGIALDSSNAAYISGSTSSLNLPVTPGAYQQAYGAAAPTPSWPSWPPTEHCHT